MKKKMCESLDTNAKHIRSIPGRNSIHFESLLQCRHRNISFGSNIVRTIHIKSANFTVHHAIGGRIADLRTFFLQNWSKHIQSIAENAWVASEIIAAETLRIRRSLFCDSYGIDGGR